MIIGGDTDELSAYIGRKFDSNNELGEQVRLDLNEPHMVTVCGKRGSGKSHTLGVMMEELMTLPAQVKQNLNGLVIDAMGIYWSLQVQTPDTDLLDGWDISPREYPVKVYYPAGLEEQYEEIQEYFHEGFELYPSELAVDDWLYLLDIDETQAQAGLLSQVIEEAEEDFGQYYSIMDLLDKVEASPESANIKDALHRRLEKAKNWGIFSSSGSKIEEIVEGGEFVVLDLSGAGALPWNVRTMLTGILVKKMYNKRSFDRSREEVKKIKGEHTEVNFRPIRSHRTQHRTLGRMGPARPPPRPLPRHGHPTTRSPRQPDPLPVRHPYHPPPYRRTGLRRSRRQNL